MTAFGADLSEGFFNFFFNGNIGGDVDNASFSRKPAAKIIYLPAPGGEILCRCPADAAGGAGNHDNFHTSPASFMTVSMVSTASSIRASV